MASNEIESLREALNGALARADREGVLAMRDELERLSFSDDEAAAEASFLAQGAAAALGARSGLEAECKESTPYVSAYISLGGERPMYRCVTHPNDRPRVVHTWPAT